jgi:hypothetical protein
VQAVERVGGADEIAVKVEVDRHKIGDVSAPALART